MFRTWAKIPCVLPLRRVSMELYSFSIRNRLLFERTSFFWIPQRTSLTFALAVAGIVLFAPDKACASCGHYVHVGTESSAAIQHETQPPLPAGSPSTPAPRHSPCNGPHCSHLPDQPPLAPVTAPLPTTEQW